MFNKIIFAGLAVCALLLLFIDVGSLFSQRLIEALWPIGHLSVFCFWSFLLLHYHSTIRAFSLLKQCFTLTLLCFSFGLSIEIIQPYFSREMEVQDLFLNYMGVLLSIILFSKHPIHWLFKVSYLLLIGLVLHRSALLIYDEAKAQIDFPVLASFDQEIELTRWKADQPLTIEKLIVQTGSNSMMQITFVPRQYSGVALRYFPGDWQNYNKITMRFYNPNPDALPVTLIIIDQHYDKGHPNYRDRYDQHLTIAPGYSEQSILLATIQAGVELREMDLNKIAGVDFYMYKLKSPIHLYLDSMYLQ